MNIQFSKLESNKDAPMDLLLLADPSVELVKSYLEKGLCYIAQIDDEIIGVTLIMETSSGTAEIMNVAIKEEYQNKGIGKQLVMYTIEMAKKEGYKALEIGTGNPGAIQMLLYQKCGFRIVGIDFDFFRRNYSERIYENGIECRDMIRMKMEL